ncbi:hypothetical protein DPV78_003775 [Talaromyces pinophilus]|nr:hypothetical protein DPV78_003775 [Talaromyces pinophilus]
MPHSIPQEENPSRNYVPFWTADNLADTKEIPTYLFRLNTPWTDGTTTCSRVCPPMPRNTNLLDLNTCIAADHLYAHFDWERKHETTCNFMSWSSSLLFLIQYAFFRYTRWQHRDFNDIKLLVVDTRKLPKGIFAKDMDLLEELSATCKSKFYCRAHNRLANFLRMRNGANHFGEYLTQGALDIFDGESIQVNFQKMVDLGLIKLLPNDMGNEENWNQWPTAVVAARGPFSEPIDAPPALKEEVGTAIAIAKILFKGPWSLPVAAMLLSLKPRQRNDPVILNGFLKIYGADIIRNTVSQGLVIDGERLPEVQQYRYIIDDIASAVLQNDESAASDSHESDGDNCASLGDLTLRMGGLDLVLD